MLRWTKIAGVPAIAAVLVSVLAIIVTLAVTQPRLRTEQKRPHHLRVVVPLLSFLNQSRYQSQSNEQPTRTTRRAPSVAPTAPDPSPRHRSLGSVVVTNYSERQHGDPDVEVQFDYEGHTVTGFIDARRQNDGVWEAWVGFSYAQNDGFRGYRKDWIPMDQLTVVSIDDRPVTEQPDAEAK